MISLHNDNEISSFFVNWIKIVSWIKYHTAEKISFLAAIVRGLYKFCWLVGALFLG